MKRLISFLRTAVPADLWQLVFLVGVVCLTLCPRLAWRVDMGASRDAIKIFDVRPDWGRSFYTILSYAILPITFASLAGYFVCFWPGRRPARRMLFTVVVPAFVGLAAIFAAVALGAPVHTSVLQSSSSRAADAFQMIVLFAKYSVGLHFCLLGLFLISIFTVCLYLNRSRLPLVLPQCETEEEDQLWRRTKMLVYLMIGPMFVLEIITSLPAMLVYLFRGQVLLGTAWILSWELAEALLVLCLVLWIMTAAGRQIVAGKLQVPNRNFFLLALGSASAVAAVIPLSAYFYDRAHWAAVNYGKYSPPELGDYFSVPHITVVGSIAAAVLEEVVFRGFIQSRMTERYGLMRGLFFTGMAWAAIHFRSDSYPAYSDIGAVVHLFLRIAMCLALSFVFGWLTLKSGSILPAMFAHAAINLFAAAAVTFPELPGESDWAINIALWAILAYGLFRYWPPKLEENMLPVGDDGETAPAT